MITWVTPIAIIPIIENLQNDDLQSRFVEDRIETPPRVKQQALVVHVWQQLAKRFKDSDDQYQRNKYIDFVWPASFRFIES